jgi:hypothetical protein
MDSSRRRIKEPSMFRYRHNWVRIGVTLLAGLFLAGRSAAVAPEIKDEAKFFSPEAIKDANKQIRDIARKYEKDLFIETVAAVPSAEIDKVKAMAPAERRKFFANWATDRAEAAVVNGIYVFVCKDPTFVQVVVTPKAQRDFNAAARDKLGELLVKEFHDKHFDQGLKEAVRFVAEKLAGASGK